MFGFWFLCGPTYLVWELFFYRYNTLSLDVSGYKVTSFLIGAGITVLALIVSGAVLYALIAAQRAVAESGETVLVFNFTTSTLMALLVSLGFVVLVQLWTWLSYHVTDVEQNSSWFTFRMSQALKLILFKIGLSTEM